jgi:membrane-associated phospholipid phosphatase
MPRPFYFRVVPLAIIILSATSRVSPAQVSEPPAMHATGLVDGVFHFAGDVGHDLSVQATYPFRLARERPGRFLLGTSVLLGLVVTDNATHNALASPDFVRDHGLLGPAQWMSDNASPSRALPLAAAVGAMSLLGSPRERETGAMLTEALVTSSVWTGSLKYLTGRERPRETSELAADWTGPGASFTSEPVDGRGLRSFPSGHTSSAWAVATVVAHQYPSHGIVPVLAYGAATAMAYSRMAVGAHWLSDVVAGGLIGYGCASQVISAHEGDGPGFARGTDPGFHLFLESDRDMRGVGLAYQF